MAFIVDFNMQGQQVFISLAAILDGSVDFFSECCHVGAATTVDDLYRLGAHVAQFRAVHGKLKAVANDNNILTGEVVAMLPSPISRSMATAGTTPGVAFDAEFLV